MGISEVCVRRPVFSTVLTLVIVLLGIVCQTRLSVRQLPRIEKPVISVETSYPGANPEVVETQVTKLLEGSFATIQGVELITSHSSNEQSTISLTFREDRSVDAAAGDVRDRLARTQDQLPHDIPASIVRKADADARSIITIVITSDHHSTDAVRDYVDRYIKAKFEVLNGVARIDVFGGSERAMHIRLDPHKMAAYGLTPLEVREAIHQQNLQRPGGRIVSQDREYMLMTIGEFTTPEEFNELIVANTNGKSIRLMDVGRAEFSPKEVRDGMWVNGRDGVGLSLVKQATANPLDVGRLVKKLIPEIEKSLPAGMKLVLAWNSTKYIEHSINRVYRTLFESTLLVVGVVFLFLWSARAAFVPLVTIPVSIVGTFFILYLFNFSINMITLLALVLAIGLVVDDAIVVLENVHRHMSKGVSRFQAAIQGTQEIAFAIIAMTLTLAAVYTPISLTPGKIGSYFKEFSVALAGSVLISGFVALTLSPMMCSKFLSQKPKRGEAKHATYLKNIEDAYRTALKWAFAQRWKTLSAGFLFSLLGFGLASFYLPSENIPAEDDGYLSLSGYGPTSATYTFMKRYAQQVDDLVKKIPELELRNINVNGSTIEGGISLKDWNRRSRTSQEVTEAIRPELKEITGVDVNVYCSKGSGTEGSIVEFVLQTNGGYDYLERYGNAMNALLYGMPTYFSRVEGSLVPTAQEYTVELNRERAASLGVRVGDVADTVEILIRGRVASRLKQESKRYDVFIKVEDALHKTPSDIINNIFVRSKEGQAREGVKMVPLSDLVSINSRQAPVTLDHYDQMLSLRFKAEIAKGRSLGEAVAMVESLRTRFLPEDIWLSFSGSTRSFLEENQQMYFIFCMALLFIYLVLAAQFESFIDPFIILLSVPLSLAGAFLTLLCIEGGSLNIYSEIGLVTLIGLITKHGILIVDFANKLRESGKKRLDVIIEAATLRLRPILMTTFAMVLGTFPLALSTGAGAGSCRQIGWAIVGGMTFGTFFTLFIVPIVYDLFARRHVDKKPIKAS
ncbi:MAG: efflux RND transporter permease subunit [Holosporales bacterium]|jgi:multidrug efflux pump|nr:efflux RND transporter permease subunit [Holosporales bacterium]